MATSTIPQASVIAVQNITGYHFIDNNHLWIALQAAASSVIEIGGRFLGTDGNKGQALLGDAVLKLVIVRVWHRDNDVLIRGAAANLIDTIATNANLNMVGQTLGLGAYINRNPSSIGNVGARVMADTVEALIGAIFLDSGEDLDAVEAAMRAMNLL